MDRASHGTGSCEPVGARLIDAPAGQAEVSYSTDDGDDVVVSMPPYGQFGDVGDSAAYGLPHASLHRQSSRPAVSAASPFRPNWW